MDAQLITEDEIEPGDILLFTNAVGESRVTTWLTHSPYYHAGIYAGHKKSIEMRMAGAIQRDLRSKDGNPDFVIIPAPEGKGAAALAWAKTRMKSKYDMRAILVLLLNRILFRLHLRDTAPDRYTCGEFVAAAYESAGVQLFPEMPLWNVEPADFARYVPPGAPTVTFGHNGIPASEAASNVDTSNEDTPNQNTAHEDQATNQAVAQGGTA